MKWSELLYRLLPNKYNKSSCFTKTKNGKSRVQSIELKETYFDDNTTIIQIASVTKARYGLIAAIIPPVVIIPFPPINLNLSLSFIWIKNLIGKQWPIVANNPATNINE